MEQMIAETKEPWQIIKARELLAELPGLKPEELADWNMKAAALIAFSVPLIVSDSQNNNQQSLF